MKNNLAQQQEIDNEISLHPSTAKKLERQAMSKKEDRYTKTPNALIDDQIMAQLNDKAFKCLMFIVRQTSGFDRTSHTIAITQFQKYCGIKKRDTVMSNIRELEEVGLIKVERKLGTLNEYFFTPDQYQEKGLVPLKGSTPKGDGTSTNEQDGGSTAKGDYTSTVERGTIKETFKENIKENFKERNAQENSVDAVLNLWTPDLHSLNSWLQRSGEMPMTQECVNQVLLEVNAFYEPRLKAGLIPENLMYSNFVKWVKRGFKPKTPTKQNLNVNDAWNDLPVFHGEVEHVELPEDFE